MPKIFIIYISSLFTFLPHILFCQDIEIKKLSSDINSQGSEFNFSQIDKKTGFYSSSTLEETGYQSAVYKTKFINNEWKKGKYFNLGDFYNTANINYDSGYYYFSGCNKVDTCGIFFTKKEAEQVYYSAGGLINDAYSNNTQPHIAQHGKQKVIYFVSNRKGGFGGLDIWVSILGLNGSFGPPINLGKNINTSADEITPFYNNWTGELFFSTNRKPKQGFDIYKSSGSINLWENSTKIDKINTLKDEMYVTFSSEKEGYFSSDRNDTICSCTDIYSFVFLHKDTIKKKNFGLTLPLNLYFHNDRPDPRTESVETKKTYRQTYNSYLTMKEGYLNINPELKNKNFFRDSLSGNFQKLTVLLDSILFQLNKGRRIDIQIKGYSSSLHSNSYNDKLSSRRISSLLNFIYRYKSEVFLKHIQTNDLKFIITPYGESKASKKTSSDPKDLIKSIYSFDAILDRKIQITDIIFR